MNHDFLVLNNSIINLTLLIAISADLDQSIVETFHFVAQRSDLVTKNLAFTAQMVNLNLAVLEAGLHVLCCISSIPVHLFCFVKCVRLLFKQLAVTLSIIKLAHELTNARPKQNVLGNQGDCASGRGRGLLRNRCIDHDDRR